MSNLPTRTALLIGASGLVGNHCLQYLLQEACYSKVRVLVRKSLELSHPKLEQHIIDFDQLESDSVRRIIQANDIYSCIGTTFLRTPNKNDYTKIDFTYPYTLAKIAKENGAEQFSFISALSANPNAFFFYSRIKGQLEQAIQDLGFKTTVICRPSYLIGDRKEIRPIEIMGVWILKLITPFLRGSLQKMKPIKAKDLAFALVKKSLEHKEGIHIYFGDELQKTSGK